LSRDASDDIPCRKDYGRQVVRQRSNPGTRKRQGPRPKEDHRQTGGVNTGKPVFALDNVLGSIAPLPGTTTENFEAQIEDATEEAAERRVRKMSAS
jgi:hypothetical protein